MANAHPTKTPAEQGPVQVVEEEFLSTEDTALFTVCHGISLFLPWQVHKRPDFAHAVMALTSEQVKNRSARAMNKNMKKGF